MKALKLTHSKAVAGQKVVHGLQGGGPGLRDAAGRAYYLRNVTWCGVQRRTRLKLVETDQNITCRRCLALMERHAK